MKKETRQTGAKRIETYFNDFIDLTEIMAKRTAKFSSDTGVKMLAGFYQGISKEQIGNLRDFILELYQKAPAEKQGEIDLAFSLSAGDSLVKGAKKMAAAAISPDVLRKIHEIVFLIKKIIFAILGLLFPLGIPPFVVRIIELLDEPIQLVIKLLELFTSNGIVQSEKDFLQIQNLLAKFSPPVTEEETTSPSAA